MSKHRTILTAFLSALVLPLVASAHEVYVLSPAQIAIDTTEPPFQMMAVIHSDFRSFVFWGLIAAVTVVFVFLISILRPLERKLDPLLARMRPYASSIARVTVGLGFISGAYFHASFGPELPLASVYGPYALLISSILTIVGTLIPIGFWARAAALVAFVLFSITAYYRGLYMLTYANYFGEITVLLILGSHRASLHSLTRTKDRFHRAYHRVSDMLTPYAFPVLRVCFGISLIYAALYAKIWHNNLALHVATLPLAGHAYGVAYYLGFEPHFLVLGAAIIEIIIGLFFVLGIEIRFTALFLLFWLSLSLVYFGEVVWPHIILIGVPIAFIFHGYDRYSLEGMFFKKGHREPVL